MKIIIMSEDEELSGVSYSRNDIVIHKMKDGDFRVYPNNYFSSEMWIDETYWDEIFRLIRKYMYTEKVGTLIAKK